MSPRGVLAALSGVFIVAIVGVVIGIIALTKKPLITTSEIQNKTVQTEDLANILENLGFQLLNGQVLKGSIFTENIPSSSVLGLASTEGEVLVTVNENGELSFQSSSVVVNGDNIVDGSIGLIDLGFNVVSSINNVINNGGNINLIDGGHLSIIGNDASNTIALEVIDGSGSGLDADLLDGEDSLFYRNASNINAGVLGTDFFSAYLDLFTEGYLDFNEGDDLVLKSQADSEYVNVGGDTMTGDLFVNANISAYDIYANNLSVGDDVRIDDTLRVDGFVTINDSVDVNGGITADNATINAQLTVADLVVTGTARVATFDDHLLPRIDNTYDVGSTTHRWRSLFVGAVNATTLALPSYPDVGATLNIMGTDISVLRTDVNLLRTDVNVLRTDVNVLRTDVNNLAAREQVISGIYTGCNGSYGLTGGNCTITLPSVVKSVTMTPISSAGTPFLSVTLKESPTGQSQVDVRITGELGGVTLSGIAWIATL